MSHCLTQGFFQGKDISAIIICRTAYELGKYHICIPWSRKDMCVQNTDQFVCAALGKPFKSNCSWRKATGNHLHICTSHVYDDALAMTVSSRTCLRAENSTSSSSSSQHSGNTIHSLFIRFKVTASKMEATKIWTMSVYLRPFVFCCCVRN